MGILSYLGTGGTAADFPLPATAFDSSFAASQSAFWFDCRNLEPTAWNPNKIWGLPLPRKKKRGHQSLHFAVSNPNLYKMIFTTIPWSFHNPRRTCCWSIKLTIGMVPFLLHLRIGQSGLPNSKEQIYCVQNEFSTKWAGPAMLEIYRNISIYIYKSK